jgi:hypothetical protein
MKRHNRYVTSSMRSILFLSVLAHGFLQPASAARLGAARQNHLRFTPLEGGSVLEFRDGQVSCRTATEEEAQAMQRNPDQELSMIGDEVVSASSTEPVQKGLKIILRGTPQLEGFPEAKAAFLRAARNWESAIQNRITVVIDVEFGPTAFGKPFGENQYGVTKFQWNFHENGYPIIRSALIRSAGSPQEAALYNSLPPERLPTDLGAAPGMIYHVTAMRALGLFPPVADPDAELASLGLPPGIAFNSAVGFDFDPSDGIEPNAIDFNAAAMHEMGHALGFFSGVGNKEEFPNIPLTPEVLDLFRFRPGVTLETFASAPRILSSGDEHIFFTGGRELPLSTGRVNGLGGDGRQAGHWKDDLLTGRYIGIMDPIFLPGLRYEITANDLDAFALIGYRTNPLPNSQETELKLEDGESDIGITGSGLIVMNRLTPPSYPATLHKVRMLIPAFKDQPDPASKPITLLIYAPGSSNSETQFVLTETTVPSASNELFLEFTIPDGPTISSGDFYVGYRAPSPHQGVGFAVDLGDWTEIRSFYSLDNGASFSPLPELFQGEPANALIRVVVSVGDPAPTTPGQIQ